MISVDVALKLGAFDLAVAFASDAGITALFGRSGACKSMQSTSTSRIGMTKRLRSTKRSMPMRA